MLRVGLTGGLGSGKSTVAAMLREHGAYVLSADDIGRKLMEPGQAVYAAIVRQFGEGVVRTDGTLDRPALARIAFGEGSGVSRIGELNAIVHPATIQLQTDMAGDIFQQDPDAVVVVESALIFETKFGGGRRERFERMVLVAAPEALKIARFVERSGGGDRPALEAEARRRLAQMIPDEVKAPQCDFILRNDGTLDELRRAVDELWTQLTLPVIPEGNSGTIGEQTKENLA